MSFNASNYMNINTDVHDAWKKDGQGMTQDQFANWHYQNHGQAEGRNTGLISAAQQTAPSMSRSDPSVVNFVPGGGGMSNDLWRLIGGRGPNPTQPVSRGGTGEVAGTLEHRSGGSTGGIIGGTGQSSGAGGHQSNASAAGSTFTPWQVTPQQTVQQQAYDVINRDSPLMQQARGRAMQAMNERGLINSSLGIQAGQDAVMDRALQIAQPDAATFARSGEFNAGQQNAWNLAQQELGMKGDQFNQELAFKREAMMLDADLKRELMDKETKYKSLLEGDAAFNKQYAMYVDSLYQIDKDPNLSAEAKQAAKFQQARMLEDYATLRGLNLNLDFSSRFRPAEATAPAPSTAPTATTYDNFGA